MHVGRWAAYALLVAIELDSAAVLESTAALMAFRLREGGFSTAGGGREVETFTTGTTPTLARATSVTDRQSALASNDFPGADDADEPELRTVASLRSAIELELSVPNYDSQRVKDWREELREYVKRFSAMGSDSGQEGEPGEEGGLKPVWDFGPQPLVRAEGSECPIIPSRRLRW